MVRRFCPKCGKSVNELIQTDRGLFCKQCVDMSVPIIKIGDRFDFYQCTLCGKVSATGSRDSWIGIDQNDPRERLREILLRLYVQKYIKTANLNVDLKIPENIGQQEKIPPFEALLFVEFPGNENKSAKFSIFVKPHYSVCTNCSRRRGHYFTATVQIRGNLLSNISVREDLLDEIQKYTNDLEEKNESMFVSKVIQERQGFDLQVSTRFMANLIATYIKKKYGAKLEETKRLMGIGDDGGEIYRHTIAVHLLPYRKNFVVGFEDEPCLVQKINGKTTIFFSLKRKIIFRKENKMLFSRPIKILAIPENFLRFEIISEEQSFFHLTNLQTGATFIEMKSNLPQNLQIGSQIFGVQVNDKIFYFMKFEV